MWLTKPPVIDEDHFTTARMKRREKCVVGREDYGGDVEYESRDGGPSLSDVLRVDPSFFESLPQRHFFKALKQTIERTRSMFVRLRLCLCNVDNVTCRMDANQLIRQVHCKFIEGGFIAKAMDSDYRELVAKHYIIGPVQRFYSVLIKAIKALGSIVFDGAIITWKEFVSKHKDMDDKVWEVGKFADAFRGFALAVCENALNKKGKFSEDSVTKLLDKMAKPQNTFVQPYISTGVPWWLRNPRNSRLASSHGEITEGDDMYHDEDEEREEFDILNPPYPMIQGQPSGYVGENGPNVNALANETAAAHLDQAGVRSGPGQWPPVDTHLGQGAGGLPPIVVAQPYLGGQAPENPQVLERVSVGASGGIPISDSGVGLPDGMSDIIWYTSIEDEDVVIPNTIVESLYVSPERASLWPSTVVGWLKVLRHTPFGRLVRWVRRMGIAITVPASIIGLYSTFAARQLHFKVWGLSLVIGALTLDKLTRLVDARTHSLVSAMFNDFPFMRKRVKLGWGTYLSFQLYGLEDPKIIEQKWRDAVKRGVRKNVLSVEAHTLLRGHDVRIVDARESNLLYHPMIGRVTLKQSYIPALSELVGEESELLSTQVPDKCVVCDLRKVFNAWIRPSGEPCSEVRVSMLRHSKNRSLNTHELSLESAQSIEWVFKSLVFSSYASSGYLNVEAPLGM